MFAEELEYVKSAAKQQGISLSQHVRNKLLADRPSIPSQSLPISEVKNQSNQPASEEQTHGKKTAASFESDVSRKSSHILGCNCVVCERLRRLLRPATGKQSASESVLRETQQGKKSK